MSPRAASWVCRGLLALELTYSVAVAFVEELPDWRMFHRARAVRYALRDREGHDLNAYDFLPAGSYLTDPRQPLSVARFVCRRHPERAPLSLRDLEARTEVRLTPPHCDETPEPL